MAGSISNFKSSFTGDLARSNRFDVNIPVPISLLPYLKTSRDLIYRCENANLPSKTFATTEQKIYGPIEKHPYLTTYNDIDLTFIVDDNMNQKVFFDAWLNYINPSYNYNFRYKDDYSTTITINQYNVKNEVSYSINLYEAFPVSMNQLDLDWSSDGYHKLIVTFAYTYWKNNSIQELGMEFIDAGIASVIDELGGLGGNVLGGIDTAINNIPRSVESIFKKG